MRKMLAAAAAAAAAALACFAGPTAVHAQVPAPAPAAPSPKWEGDLRQAIDQLQRGQPDYDKMAPALADATRQQAPQIKQAFDQLGKLTTVKFEQTAPDGAEIYTVTFEHGSTKWGILVGPDGKIAGLGFGPG